MSEIKESNQNFLRIKVAVYLRVTFKSYIYIYYTYLHLYLQKEFM